MNPSVAARADLTNRRPRPGECARSHTSCRGSPAIIRARLKPRSTMPARRASAASLPGMVLQATKKTVYIHGGQVGHPPERARQQSDVEISPSRDEVDDGATLDVDSRSTEEGRQHAVDHRLHHGPGQRRDHARQDLAGVHVAPDLELCGRRVTRPAAGEASAVRVGTRPPTGRPVIGRACSTKTRPSKTAHSMSTACPRASAARWASAATLRPMSGERDDSSARAGGTSHS